MLFWESNHTFSMKFRGWYILLCLFVGLPIRAQQIKVETRLDAAEILIGQQVKMQTVVTSPRSVAVVFPQFANDTLTNGVEIVERSAIDTLLSEDGKWVQLLRTYTLTAFDSARYVLPRFEVQAQGQTHQAENELVLKVNLPALDKQQPEQLRPPHGVVEPLFEWSARSELLSLLLHALFVFVLWAVYRVSNKKLSFKKVWVYPPPPAHELALSTFEEIQKQGYNPAHSSELFSALNEAFRLYLKARYGFQATEMTSSEILTYLHQIAPTAHLAGADLYRFFEWCDWVKFAQYRAMESQWKAACMMAHTFVVNSKMEDSQVKAPKLQEQPYEARIQVYWRRTILVMAILAALIMLWGVCEILILMWQIFL